MSICLEVKNIRKEYNQKVALDRISLSIEKGKIFGLLGPNGAGKTTFIRIINQITAPDTGSIQFNGMDFKREHITRIGYLPEERGLYKNMKVGEQCLYLARLKGLSKTEAKQQIHYWFQRLEMLDWLPKKVEELSKGMAQKVQFISTIIHQPELIILDEPFSGFDPINSEIIKQEVLRLKEQGTTIILSTHRMESVEELCDDIALINAGQCVLYGQVTQIKEKYKKDIYKIEYRGTLKTPEGFNVLENDNNIALIKATQKQSSNQLLSKLIKQVDVVSFKEKLPSINDIFIQSVSNE